VLECSALHPSEAALSRIGNIRRLQKYFVVQCSSQQCPRHEGVLLHFGIATWQKKTNKKGPPNVPVLEDVLGNTEYKKWLDGEKSKEGNEDLSLNSLCGHRKDL
jgi:hypothetical protein